MSSSKYAVGFTLQIFIVGTVSETKKYIYFQKQNVGEYTQMYGNAVQLASHCRYLSWELDEVHCSVTTVIALCHQTFKHPVAVMIIESIFCFCS